jgi:hypothetical protein
MMTFELIHVDPWHLFAFVIFDLIHVDPWWWKNGACWQNTCIVTMVAIQWLSCKCDSMPLAVVICSRLCQVMISRPELVTCSLHYFNERVCWSVLCYYGTVWAMVHTWYNHIQAYSSASEILLDNPLELEPHSVVTAWLGMVVWQKSLIHPS